jgi:hypothetical protein
MHAAFLLSPLLHLGTYFSSVNSNFQILLTVSTHAPPHINFMTFHFY